MDASLSLERAQEVMLLQDLCDLAQDKEFHTACRLMPEPNRVNHIHIMLPVGTCLAEIHVTFREYPSEGVPDIQPGEDELSNLLARRVTHQLVTNTSQLNHLKDVVAALREASNRLCWGHQAYKTQANQSPSLPDLMGVPLAQALIGSLVQAAVSSLTDVVVPFVAYALVLTVPQEQDPQPGSTSGAIQTEPLPTDSSDHVASVVPGVITKLFLSETLLATILRDGSRHKPNEYAFICSGILAPEGVATVFDYYAGEMEISTPSFCKLTKASIIHTLYEAMPRSHNLVVWGHTHPVEGPSCTDMQAFDEVAAWDEEIAQHGVLMKHSIAMLINARSQSLRFYDTHTKQEIVSMVVPRSGRQKPSPMGGIL